MTTPAPTARQKRRRREHERQAVIYGVLIAALTVVGLGAWAIFTGAIDAPFAREFTPAHPLEEAIAPCLPPVSGGGAPLPLPSNEIHLNIFNASGRAGVAAAHGTVMEERGFAVGLVANYGSQLPVSELRFGMRGVRAAYTVTAHFPGTMRMVLDARTDGTVDLVVGEVFNRPLDEASVPLSPTTPLRNQPDCRPVGEIEPRPAPPPRPTPTPTPTPEELPPCEEDDESDECIPYDEDADEDDDEG